MNDQNKDPEALEIPATPAAGKAADRLELTIEKVVTGGVGLARHEGQAVFVPLTAPGDRVAVQVKRRRKGYLQTSLLEVLESGPDRQTAPCGHYGECGGCDLQHLTTLAQRRIKAEIVADCFGRLGRLDVAGLLEGPNDAGADLGYRNRIRLYAHPAGPYGLMRRGSHDVVPLDACPLLPEQFNAEILPWLRFLPPVEQIVVRMDGRGGWLLSVFGPPARLKVMKKILGQLADGEAPAPGCSGILFNNLPIWGRDYLLLEVAGRRFRVGAASFFQGNLEVAEEAVATAGAWLDELAGRDELGVLLGDLFCGVGLFSLTLADRFEKVVAVDSDADACRDAVNNVARDADAKDKVTVREGALADVLGDPELAPSALWAGACCVVDPPRTGLGPDGLKAILAAGPRHLIYMSCDPATLARDAGALVAGGYRLLKVRVLDMFPQTAHIETLVLLEKQG